MPPSVALSVWTGSEALFWATRGPDTSGTPSSLAAYDPKRDSWRTLAEPPDSPLFPYWTTPVWKGSELILWWNEGPATSRDGLIYSIATDTWRDLPEAPIPPRYRAATVWTGTEAIYWGGIALYDSAGTLGVFEDRANGAAYNPVSDTWRVIAASPLAARSASAFWTGSEMLVVAGHSGVNVPFTSGGDGHLGRGSQRWEWRVRALRR